MNKQLKELAVQAKLPNYLLEYGTELCVAPHLEKFAELIKNEYCAVVTELGNDYRQIAGNEDICKALAIANARIYARLGVKE